MKFEIACSKAMRYKEEHGDSGDSIKDLGNLWLFDGADAERNVIYGEPGITIDKETGELGYFILPDIENFKLTIVTKKATEVETPRSIGYDIISREIRSVLMEEFYGGTVFCNRDVFRCVHKG